MAYRKTTASFPWQSFSFFAFSPPESPPIKESLCQKIIESAKPIYAKAAECPDKTSALHQVSNELSSIMSTLSFEVSCDYSKKLALLFFDQFCKQD